MGSQARINQLEGRSPESYLGSDHTRDVQNRITQGMSKTGSIHVTVIRSHEQITVYGIINQMGHLLKPFQSDQL